MTTLIAWLALLAALAAGGYAWKLNQELDTARRRLDRYNKALFDAGDQIRSMREQLDETRASLRVEIMQRTGTPAFTPEMTVREIELLHPQASEVLAGFHMGGCSSCAVEASDTLATVCAQSGIPVEQVVGHLNVLLGDRAAPRSGNGGSEPVTNGHFRPYVPQPVKLPNVEIDF